MKAVILAGGLGTRLKPFTDIIPKPLLPLRSYTLLEIQIKHLKENGFTEVFLATNYKSDFIQAYIGDGDKYGIKISYSVEDQPLGTCGPLSLLRDHLKEPFLMMNGDILTKLNLNVFMQDAVLKKCDLTVGTKVITTPFRFGNVEVDKDDYLIKVEEKPTLFFEVLAGIYALTPECLKIIPDKKMYGIDNLIHDMIKIKRPIYRRIIKDYWIDIGQVDDYDAARSAFENFYERQ